MLEQRYEREEMVRRGGKGRIEEVEGVKKEEGESFGLQRQVSCLLPWATELLPRVVMD